MNFYKIVFSPTGGTKKVANAITSAWSDKVTEIDLTNRTLDFSSIPFTDEDMVLIATPSFGGRVPPLVAERLASIHGKNAKATVVCVYGNRAYEDTLIELKDIVTKRGFRVIAGVSAVAEHAIIHQYASGKPNKNDINVLRDYGKKILKKATLTTPTIPGNRPYKKASGVGLVPKTNNDCIQCKLCAKKCPAGAISMDDPKSIDKSKCISCMRCVAICPKKAKMLNPLLVKVASLVIKKACSTEKKNELFIR